MAYSKRRHRRRPKVVSASYHGHRQHPIRIDPRYVGIKFSFENLPKHYEDLPKDLPKSILTRSLMRTRWLWSKNHRVQYLGVSGPMIMSYTEHEGSPVRDLLHRWHDMITEDHQHRTQ